MILVLGDNFLDRYFIGKVRGMSAEAPIPVLDITGTKEFPGGAGNVARNLLFLGAEIYHLDHSANLPVKNRLETQDHLQLARWDERDFCHPLSPASIPFREWDAVVVCDYGKGSITPDLISYLGSSLSCPIYVDTKGNPWDWVSIPHVTLFPNLSEYKRYEDQYNWFPKVVLKQGAEGLAWMEYGRVILSRPALASRVISVNGAGDTVLASFTYSATKGAGVVEALDFANAAASLVVEKPWTSAVTEQEVSERLSIGCHPTVL